MLTRRFEARVHREGELYVAVCPEMGTASQGYTVSEAIANLAGGVRFEIAAQPQDRRGTTRVTVTTFESEGQPGDDTTTDAATG